MMPPDTTYYPPHAGRAGPDPRGSGSEALAEALRRALEHFDEPIWRRARQQLEEAERARAAEEDAAQDPLRDAFAAAARVMPTLEPDPVFPILGLDPRMNVLVIGRLPLRRGARPIVRIVFPPSYPQAPPVIQGFANDGFFDLPVELPAQNENDPQVLVAAARALLDPIATPEQ